MFDMENFRFDCIVSGAGISVPSGCPDGNKLKGYLWDMICGVYADSPLELILRGFREEVAQEFLAAGEPVYFRMEQLVDLLYLGSEQNKKSFQHIFHSIYKILLEFQPNKSHWYITHVRGIKHLLTLNMDLLLEKTQFDFVDPIPIVHLHGTADNHEKILTMSGEYLEGLPIELREKFKEAIEGKNVLVVGYSGRDCDVMPLFKIYRPKKITWVQHSWDGSKIELEQEVKDLGSFLNSDTPDTFEVLFKNTMEFIGLLANCEVPADKCIMSKNDETDRIISNKVNELSKHLKDINAEQDFCNIATAMVLYEMRKFDVMEQILRTPCKSPDMEYKRIKPLSRIEKSRGNYAAARKYLRAIPFSPMWLKNVIENIDNYRLENNAAKAATLTHISYVYINLIRYVHLFFPNNMFLEQYKNQINIHYVKLILQLARITSLAGEINRSKKYLNKLCNLFFSCDTDEYHKTRPGWESACKNYGTYILSLFHERLSMVYTAQCESPPAMFAAERYLEIVMYSQPSVQALAWRTIITVMMDDIILSGKPINQKLEKRFAEYKLLKFPDYLSIQNRLWNLFIETENSILRDCFSCDETLTQFEEVKISSKFKTGKSSSELIYSTMLVCFRAMKDKNHDIGNELNGLLPKNFANRSYFKNFRLWMNLILTALNMIYNAAYKPNSEKLHNSLKNAESFLHRSGCIEQAQNTAFLLNKYSNNEPITEKDLLRIIFVLP